MGGSCAGVVNSKAEEYIEVICSYVKFKKAHKEIRTELLGHIEEKTEDLILEGINEEEASKKALAEMGQAEVIGKQLNESHKASPEWSILVMTVLFSLLGVIVAYLIAVNEVDPYMYIKLPRSIIFNVIGYIFIIGLYFFDYKRLEKHSTKLFIGVTLLLFMQLFISVPVNGMKAWMHLGPISINIAEASLFLYVIALAGMLRNLNVKTTKDFVYVSLMIGLPIFLYIQLRVLLEAAAYFVLFTVLMFKSKVKHLYVFSAIGVVAASGFYAVFSEPYRVARLFTFINPEKDPEGAGYLTIQVQKLLRSTGLSGNGFTFPKRTIPGVDSDFILTYIIYTFGWLAGIVLIISVFTFIFRMFTAARSVKDVYGNFIIRGFLCIFAVEFIWSILMVLGFLPIISVTLPFISYGGSKALTQMAAIGLIMSIYRCKSLSYA